MSKLVGLIPAAGKGVRARPYTTLVPKGMLQMNGRPNLERIITLMRDQMGIDEIYMTVGYLSEVIKKHFGDGTKFGVRLHYIDNTELDKGLAWSVLLAGRGLDRPCCVMLSDECYVGSNHSEILDFPYRDGLVTCAVMNADDVGLIKRNYSVIKDGVRVQKLLEKPQKPENNLLGLGTFILTPEFFPLLEEAFAKAESGYVEFVTFIDSLCSRDRGVLCWEMEGKYVNINDRDSLNLARYYERTRTFSDNRVSLLLTSEGTEENIGFTVRRYLQNRAIDQVFVVMPEKNCIEQTVKNSGAEPIITPANLKLFGEKLKFGLSRIPGDIIVLAEADYTFPEHDIYKLLEYLKEADIVVGTRTTRQLIEQGSDMRGLVRLANIFLAKFIEVLWWGREIRISDVGCTFRAIWRSEYLDLKKRLLTKGPEFLAEMAIETLNDRKRLIEIPVSYYNRSEVLKEKYRNRKTFMRILLLILRKRLFLP